jgi:MFS transporter, FHS family, L-fucose permease
MLQVAINPLLRVSGGEEHYAFYSALAQFVFGVASFLSPRIDSYLLLNLGQSRQHSNPFLRVLEKLTPPALPWASIYWIFAASTLVMSAVIAVSKFPRVVYSASESAGSREMYLGLLKKKVIWLYFFTMPAYVGCEQGTADWISPSQHKR